MNYSIFNILDLLDVVGVEKVCSMIETFSTKRSECEDSLNPDIELFLRNNAIQFAREKKSVTYFMKKKASDYSANESVKRMEKDICNT